MRENCVFLITNWFIKNVVPLSFNPILEILDYIREKYAEILSSEELTNVNQLLKEAQQRIADMKDRQLTLDDLLGDAESAAKSAQETLMKVREWNFEGEGLVEKFNSISDSLSDTTSRLRDLQMKAQDAIKRAGNTEEDLLQLKDLISNLQDTMATIKSLKKALEETIDNANQFTTEAASYIKNATEMFKVSYIDSMV